MGEAVVDEGAHVGRVELGRRVAYGRARAVASGARVSVRVIAAVFAADVPPDEKLVLLALADYADDAGGRIFASVAAIGRKVNVCERTARARLGRLRAAGLLVAVRYGKGGRGCATHYRIDLAAMKAGTQVAGYYPPNTRQESRKPGKPRSETRQHVAGDPSGIRHVDPSSGGPEPDVSQSPGSETDVPGRVGALLSSLIGSLEDRPGRRGALHAEAANLDRPRRFG